MRRNKTLKETGIIDREGLPIAAAVTLPPKVIPWQELTGTPTSEPRENQLFCRQCHRPLNHYNQKRICHACQQARLEQKKGRKTHV